MSNTPKYDFTVIGSGPGGYVAAIRAAQLGMKTAVIEREKIGGICLNWGCIPTKALLKSAEVLNTVRKSHQYGIKVAEPEVDFAAMIKRSRQVSDRLSKGVGFLLKKNGIDVYQGHGLLQDKNSALVMDESGNDSATISSDKFLLATGARPRNLPGLELDEKQIISYRRAMTLPEQPKSLIIIGAGAIGVEFAYFYNAIGTKVTLVEMMPQILPFEDSETVEIAFKSLKKSGIEIVTDTTVMLVDKSADGVSVTGKNSDGERSWQAELCLVAVGVQANSDGMGLSDLGVQTERGFVTVNDAYRTNVDNIWAIGDLIGAPMLAHAASHEGITAVEWMAGLDAHRIDPSRIPSCTYCQPQVASVGLTEIEVLERGTKYRVGRFPFVASSKAVAAGEREGLVKVIFDDKVQQLYGAHIVGAEATELIAELGLAQIQPNPFEALVSTVHAHPTLSEAVHEATLDALGRAIHI
ncbi:dihydrolipoyl dehydrogenase [bacterium]|nr:dihydrolipoyl dehydrogenase [bacterium]MBU1880541.1 dihydrolipoyl dehydrogenase [bacterium]